MDIAKDWKNMFLVEYAKDKFACDVLDGIKCDDNYIIVMRYYKEYFIWFNIHISSTKFHKKRMIPH